MQIVLLLNLALSDNIERNRGPDSCACNNTPKCSLCNKGVGTAKKRLQCSECHNLTQLDLLLFTFQFLLHP